MKFGVNIPNTSGEINENVVWKLESVVTTLNKIINNISTFFSYYSQMRYKFASFFIVDEIFRWKLILSGSFIKINFSKCSCQAPVSPHNFQGYSGFQCSVIFSLCDTSQGGWKRFPAVEFSIVFPIG